MNSINIYKWEFNSFIQYTFYLKYTKIYYLIYLLFYFYKSILFDTLLLR